MWTITNKTAHFTFGVKIWFEYGINVCDIYVHHHLRSSCNAVFRGKKQQSGKTSSFVKPFELMMGKILAGNTLVALTQFAIWITTDHFECYFL